MKNENELKKMQRASLLKMIVIAVIVIMFIVFGSVAWFTMNREVEGAGVQMTAEEVPFELMVTGDTTRADILQYVKENNKSVYNIGNLYNNIAKHFITSPDEEHMRIQWAGGTDEELEPGQSGDLTFYIIPNEKISANEFVTMYGDLKLFQMNIKG